MPITEPVCKILKNGNLSIEHAWMFFKNFAGAATQRNTAGSRNFCTSVDAETADILKRRGWNVKTTKPRDDEEPGYYIKVNVKFDRYPPTVWVYEHDGGAPTSYTEDMIGELDQSLTRDDDVNLIIRPYDYGSRRGEGVKISANLNKMYVILGEGDFGGRFTSKGIKASRKTCDEPPMLDDSDCPF